MRLMKGMFAVTLSFLMLTASSALQSPAFVTYLP
jgi:hypothetical protein